MSQNDSYATLLEPGTLRIERLLPGPIERVWAYLTESDKRGTWLASGVMDLSGAPFDMRFHHASLSTRQAPIPERFKKYADGVTSSHRITRCEPPRLLSFTWSDGADGLSEVSFELTQQDDTVRLILTHRRLATTESMAGTAEGWHTHLRVLAYRLDGEEPPAFWSLFAEIDGLYAKRFGMNGDGVSSAAPMVRFERILPGPIERVWEFLTDPTRLPGWFGDGTIEPRLGGAVSLMGGHVRGIVTQWNPPHRLAYSWNVLNPGETESPYPESYLTISLAPRGTEVMLTLTHLPVLERFEKQNAMGWHVFLDMLEAALHGHPAEPRSIHMARTAPRYGVDLQQLAR